MGVGDLSALSSAGSHAQSPTGPFQGLERWDQQHVGLDLETVHGGFPPLTSEGPFWRFVESTWRS